MTFTPPATPTPSVSDVLEFWFGSGVPEEFAREPLKNQSSWFMKDEEFDQSIRDRFGETLEQLKGGELPSSWDLTPSLAKVALIVMTDQFPRNAYRGTGEAFALDPIARQWTQKVLESGFEDLHPVHQWFAIMPLMHSEGLADQVKCEMLFEQLAQSHKAFQEMFENCLDFAKQHRVIIERFGRFPHRNKQLGRKSTAEEEVFLRQPGSSF